MNDAGNGADFFQCSDVSCSSHNHSPLLFSNSYPDSYSMDLAADGTARIAVGSSDPINGVVDFVLS